MFLLLGVNWQIKLIFWFLNQPIYCHMSPPHSVFPHMVSFSGLVSEVANERKYLPGFLLTDRLFEPPLNWMTGRSISMLKRGRRRILYLLPIHRINYLSNTCVQLLRVFFLHKNTWRTTVKQPRDYFTASVLTVNSIPDKIRHFSISSRVKRCYVGEVGKILSSVQWMFSLTWQHMATVCCSLIGVWHLLNSGINTNPKLYHKTNSSFNHTAFLRKQVYECESDTDIGFMFVLLSASLICLLQICVNYNEADLEISQECIAEAQTGQEQSSFSPDMSMGRKNRS